MCIFLKIFSSNRAATQMIFERCVSEEPLPFHCLTFEILNILLISPKFFPKNQVIYALINVQNVNDKINRVCCEQSI